MMMVLQQKVQATWFTEADAERREAVDPVAFAWSLEQVLLAQVDVELARAARNAKRMVKLHVYHASLTGFVQGLNLVLPKKVIGGVYHAGVEVSDFAFKMMNFVSYMMNFAFKMMNFVSKMMNFVSYMMNFAFKMMNVVSKMINFVSYMMNFAFKMVKFVSKMMNFVSYMMNFAFKMMNVVSKMMNFVSYMMNFVFKMTSFVFKMTIFGRWTATSGAMGTCSGRV